MSKSRLAGMADDLIYKRRREIFIQLSDAYGTQELAAAGLGLTSASQVSNIKTGQRTIGEKLARRIEIKAQLESGTLVDPLPMDIANTYGLVFKPKGAIPLIKWEEAGTWDGVVRDSLIGNAETFSTTKEHGPNTYALKVEGDSMRNSTGERPTYFNGDTILVDPDQKMDAKNTSRVIARLRDESLPMEQRVTFKQLIIDGPQRYLRPLNDNYSPIHDEFEVIGLVIESRAD